VLFSNQVMEFAQLYLFPRFKFPDKGWMNHDPLKKKSFSAFVKRHLQLRPGKQFAKEWDTIIAHAIVKKYTDMRCNINNDVHRTFMGNYREKLFFYMMFVVLHISLVCLCQWMQNTHSVIPTSMLKESVAGMRMVP
jgi:hypothetical protein